MHRFFRQFTRPIAMLLLAVMVLVPLADAFSCSFESEQSHAAELATDAHLASHGDESPGGKGKSPGEASRDACMHKHCHHATADLPSRPAVGAFLVKAGDPRPIDDADFLANVSDGLMRPPRI